MKFRPCIDLRNGKVVQIVGGTLTDDDSTVTSNFTSDKRPCDYATLYQADVLTGGHVIALGPGNHDAAIEALKAYPNGLQMGGGVTPENAKEYLDAGASHIIVTSYVFRNGTLDMDRLKRLVDTVGKERLVLDLSCRKRGSDYFVVTDRWQNFTDLCVTPDTLESLSSHCAEFLVHGVDVEGLRAGIEDELVTVLGTGSPIPATYAGGARSLDDLDRVNALGNGRVDLTIGSALDIFGGDVAYTDVLEWNKRNQSSEF
jgi:phosphoribosylformimino-5-aminoimidazole carboxamide ribotide isomerase